MSKTVKDMEAEMKRMRYDKTMYEIMLDLISKLQFANEAYEKSMLYTAYESVAANIVGAEYAKAKKKHPVFPRDPAGGLCLISEELGELAEVINDKGAVERQIEEAAHVAVTAIRFIEQRL